MPKPVSLESPTEVVANPEHDRRLRRRSLARISIAFSKQLPVDQMAGCRPVSSRHGT
jgi:hypothetical protein